MTELWRSPVSRVPQSKDPQIDTYGPYNGDWNEIGGRESNMPEQMIATGMTVSHVGSKS